MDGYVKGYMVLVYSRPSYPGLEFLTIFCVIFTQNIIDDADFGNKVCIMDIEVLDMVSSQKFSCGPFRDPSQHPLKIREGNYIGV